MIFAFMTQHKQYTLINRLEWFISYIIEANLLVKDF